MNRYTWQYRGGEITGSVIAENSDDAYKKLYAERPDFHQDMFEVKLEEKDVSPRQDHVRCEICGETIKAGEQCYQIRYGSIEDDGITFLPERDVEYNCQDCGVLC